MRLADKENDLNHILSTCVNFENEIKHFSAHNNVAMTDVFQTGQSDLVLATLDIQCIIAKFDSHIV